MPKLTFQFHDHGKTRRDTVMIEQVVIAGWTGRDPAAIQHHIGELAAIGVKPPSAVPLYYRVAASLLTQAPVIQVLGKSSSGEIEPVLFGAGGRLWLTLGSDHTDREAEQTGVALSKQLCAKPVAREAWLWDEIQQANPEDVDRLLLSSSIIENAEQVTYQQGSLAQIRPLGELIAGLETACGLALTDGSLMFCGTLGAIGAVRGSTHFSGRLQDPLGRRSLRLDYAVDELAMVA